MPASLAPSDRRMAGPATLTTKKSNCAMNAAMSRTASPAAVNVSLRCAVVLACVIAVLLDSILRCVNGNPGRHRIDRPFEPFRSRERHRGAIRGRQDDLAPQAAP